MSTFKDKKKTKDTTQKKGKTQNSTRPKSGVPVNKKTSEPTQSNGQGDNDFLRDLLSSKEELEQQWFERMKQLFERKKKVKLADKFTMNLGRLYDALLEEMSRICGEHFTSMFTEGNISHTTEEEKNDSSQVVDERTFRECEKKLKDSEITIKSLKDEKSKLEKENANLKSKSERSEDQSKTINDLKVKISKLEKNQKEQSNMTPRKEDESTAKVSDDAELKIKELKEELEKLKREKSQVEESRNKSNKEKDTQVDKLNTSVNDLKKELAECKQAKSELENKIKSLETLSKDDKNKTLEMKNAEVEKLTAENKRLKTNEEELKQLRELRQTFQTTEKQLNDEIKGLKEKNETLESCVKQIKEQLEKEKSEMKKMKKNSEKSPDQRVKELQDENTVLRDRLSQIAGSKMTDGNPAIADLGDPNRPTQLGEKFSELYDNEWTDAMEELEGSGDEKTNITTIRNIIEKAYEFGKTRSGTFMKELEKSLLSLSNSIQVTPAISKLMKELRKGIATMVTEGMYQAFIDSHTEFKLGGDHLKSFIRKAVGLSWLMAIQDPPVVMSTKASGKFDSDRFRHYTKSGGSVDYVVWPVVYLHEGGPIICKGVAQGK